MASPKNTDGAAATIDSTAQPPAKVAAPTVYNEGGEIGVQWVAPEDNGSAITGYIV
jgi:hypothetical protein